MLEKIFEETTLKDAILVLIAAFAAVSFWRGVWGLMDIYLFPERPSLSLTISLIIGLSILLMIAFYKGNKK